jgi:hypothetical protein
MKDFTSCKEWGPFFPPYESDPDEASRDLKGNHLNTNRDGGASMYRRKRFDRGGSHEQSSATHIRGTLSRVRTVTAEKLTSG